ncbi:MULTISPECIES: hypothetical protein [Bacillus cereus group]|uniref:Uncharacterized protein n=1 Tax=Bacillus thuringiensis serovar sooncheon TaxID=180891 RepID=A0A9Q5SE97_BACTU|nr:MULTISPECIES: hypothetical protein [Bacillus cereus group]OTW71152.1 hypothetical protein BK707_10050 [Bacillus thuringiensis serovar coreanensis]OTX41455.1 hypothetical protein BK724_29745 [Bacillus thuringiensis serovar sooncheon]OTX47458.1 hypothetical protein BK725_28680 [Bacillus thuringiensis serovar guiyangiensis]OTX65836.1 hypothetical protein BK727_23705 [Bacillus thuringiensis serovar roskildiensis]
MKLNKLVLSCGVISALTLGVLGNNTYAEEIHKTNDTVHIVAHVPADLLLTQTMDYSGEAVTSFVYNGSENLSFFIKNNGQNTMGYSVKGPNMELIVGGYIKPGEQQINVTNVQNALSPLPSGTYKIYVLNDDGSKGQFQVSVRSKN